MGSVASMVKDFLESHEKMLSDLQVKEAELEKASSLLPSLVNSGDEGSRNIQYRLGSLHTKWDVCRKYLEQRVYLASLYYKIHQLAVESRVIPVECSTYEERLFLTACEDKFLDIKRAVICVETLLDHFNSGKQSLLKLRTMINSQASSMIDSADTWEMFARQVKESQSCVEKAEQDMFPVITAELITSQHIIEFLRKPVFSQSLEKQMKIAESLTVKPDLQSHKDKLIKTLADCERRFQHMITEYKVLVSLMTTFFKNVFESYNVKVLLQSVNELETALHEHLANKRTILELFRFTQNEASPTNTENKSSGKELTLSNSYRIFCTMRTERPPKIEPLNISHLDVHKINMVLDSDKKNWENLWEQHRHRLEQDLQLCHFNEDLKQISLQITELSKQLENMKGNYGNSVTSTQNTSTAFFNFENTIEMLEKQIKTFSSTAEKLLTNQHYDSSHIEYEITQLQTKWSKFHQQVSQHRSSIDLSIEYLKLMDEAEEWLTEGSRILITIARKSTSVKTPEEANTLLEEIENFTKRGDVQQDERLKKLSKMAVQLFGENSLVHVQPTLEKTREMKDSFVVINDELFSLAENLKDAEQQMMRARVEQTSEMYSSRSISEVQSSTFSRTLIAPYAMEPRPPEFTSLLGDANVLEGVKVRFECSVFGTPTPQVTWYKDGIIIENNPDYKTSFSNGLCTLSIEETFSEDSAKFMCRAVNMVGIAETQGRLFVQEARPHEELAAPDFVKRLEPAAVTVGQSFQFECQVTGHPLPLVVWTKDDVCIDNVPDYVITYNNGQCILRFEEIFQVDEATYSCKASNQAGEAASSARLTVQAEEMTEPPSFPTSLSNVMARAGQKIKLECTVKGRPKPNITWLHNHKLIKESTKQTYYEGGKATLLIPEAFPKDAGTYLIIAKNKAGEATSSCNVSVKGRLPMETSDSELASDLEPVKPRVVVPLDAVTVIEGKKARLDCTIVGQPEPEVIWYHDGKPVKESNDFQLLFKGDQCSLIIREAYIEDAGTYRCSAINSAGEASSQCQLNNPLHHSKKTMSECAVAPKFTKVLNDTTIQVGRDLTLECNITGQPDPICTWHKGDKQIGSVGRLPNKSGLLSLYITQVTADDEGVYTVKASNSAGDSKCIANVSVVSEKKGPTVPPKPKILAPGFTQLFSDQLVQKGKSITFECVVAGNPKPEVQWLFNEAPVKPWDYEISTAGDRHWLTIPVAGPRHHGRFELKAENDHGKAVCSAKLDVSTVSVFEGLDRSLETTPLSMRKRPRAPVFKEPVLSAKVEEGKNFVCSQLLKPKPNVRWFKDENEVSRTPGINLSFLDNKAELTIMKVECKDTGFYKCTAENIAGNAASSADVQVTVESEIPAFKQPLKSVVIDEGQTAVFVAVITGLFSLFHQIKCSELLFGIFGIFVSPSAEAGRMLRLTKTVEDESGCYKCTAYNSAGTASSEASLEVTSVSTVYTPPTFTRPLSDISIREGAVAVLSGDFEACPEPAVRWFKDGSEIRPDASKIRLETSPSNVSVIIPSTTVKDSGRYTCSISNMAGTGTSTGYLKVKGSEMPPQFDKRLEAMVVKSGDRVRMVTDVSGIPNPTVEWFKDENIITNSPDCKISSEGKRRHVMTIPEAFPDDSGKYAVVAKNKCGESKSAADLIVEEDSLQADGPKPIQGQKEMGDLTSSALMTLNYLRRRNGWLSGIIPLYFWKELEDEDVIDWKGAAGRRTPNIPYNKSLYYSWYWHFSCECMLVHYLLPIAYCLLPPRAPLLEDPSRKLQSTLEYVTHSLSGLFTLLGAHHDGLHVFILILPEFLMEFVGNSALNSRIPGQIANKGLMTQSMVSSSSTFVSSSKKLECYQISSKSASSVEWEPVKGPSEDQTDRPNIPEDNLHGPVMPKYMLTNKPKIKYESILSSDSEYFSQSEYFSHSDTSTSQPKKPALKKSGRRSKFKKEVCIEERPVVGAKVVPPLFTVPLAETVLVKEGSLAKMECTVSGCPAPEVRWLRNDRPIPNISDFQMDYDKLEGVASLIIPEAFQEDCGKFTCVATNVGGSKMTIGTLLVQISPQDPTTKCMVGTSEKYQDDFGRFSHSKMRHWILESAKSSSFRRSVPYFEKEQHMCRNNSSKMAISNTSLISEQPLIMNILTSSSQGVSANLSSLSYIFKGTLRNSSTLTLPLVQILQNPADKLKGWKQKRLSTEKNQRREEPPIYLTNLPKIHC
ncbi:Muscle M-line assembly protein unc-89 [Nymphon striatum]|nr:Muscle M-line assembly protein unc-89 [Nymphon striatum]